MLNLPVIKSAKMARPEHLCVSAHIHTLSQQVHAAARSALSPIPSTSHDANMRTGRGSRWPFLVVALSAASSLVIAHGGGDDDGGHATVVEGDGTYAEIHMAQEVSLRRSSAPSTGLALDTLARC